MSHLGAITKYPVSARLPGLQQPALNVMGAVQQLALSSQKLSDDTSDEVSKSVDDFMILVCFIL